MLESIAAAVIGGVSLRGGVGRVELVALGALFLSLVTNGMNLLRVDSKIQTIVIGAVLIIAVRSRPDEDQGTRSMTAVSPPEALGRRSLKAAIQLIVLYGALPIIIALMYLGFGLIEPRVPLRRERHQHSQAEQLPRDLRGRADVRAVDPVASIFPSASSSHW